MIKEKLRHPIRAAKAAVREHVVKRMTRSSGWSKLRKQFLRQHPTCAACGGKVQLQVHHKEPFHTDPDMELNPDNLIALCMGAKDCHLKIGHGGSFKSFSPTVVDDAAIVLADPKQFDIVAERAEANRLPNVPEK